MGKVAAGAYIALSMTVFAGTFFRASREDELLKEKFGGEWQLWAARVPSKFTPWIYQSNAYRSIFIVSFEMRVTVSEPDA